MMSPDSKQHKFTRFEINDSTRRVYHLTGRECQYMHKEHFLICSQHAEHTPQMGEDNFDTELEESVMLTLMRQPPIPPCLS